MRRLLLLVLLALGLVAVGQSPAHACSGQTGPVPVQLREAGSVFTGTVTTVVGSPRAKQGQTITYTVQVRRVYRGGAPAEITIVARDAEPDCATQGLERRRTYLFMSSAAGAQTLPAESFGLDGIRRATPEMRATVADVLGVGSAPTTEPSETVEETARLTRVAADDPPEFLPMALPGILLLVVGMLALMLARLVSRTRSGP